MERLIRDLLDVSAIECGTLAVDPAPVRPAEVLAEAVDAHLATSAELGIGLSVDCDGGLPEIAADFQRLLQILGNLLGNAMKFTPRGGHIVVGASRNAREVLFRVSDTGRGIPLDQLPHIFSRFSQRRARSQDGVGLGLTICKAIVDAHGGRIWVDSGVGRGTTVWFTMPLDDALDLHTERVGSGFVQHQRGASEKSC
jgi:signal transduction histidine kinase